MSAILAPTSPAAFGDELGSGSVETGRGRVARAISFTRAPESAMTSFHTKPEKTMLFEHSEYRGPELRRLLEEQDLTKPELAQIMQTDRRDVYRYLKDERRVLNVRWRLLMLELGLQRPNWTRPLRRRRALQAFADEFGLELTAKLTLRRMK